MNIEDLKQAVSNRGAEAVSMCSVEEREPLRRRIQADVDAFIANGGKIDRRGIQINNKPTIYNTAYGVNAK